MSLSILLPLITRQREPNFEIKDKGSCFSLLTSLLKILLESLKPSILAGWFVTDIFRDVVDCSVQAFHFLLAPTCPASEAKRARYVTRLVGAMVSTLFAFPAYEGIAEAIRLNLLVQRLSDGPSVGWDNEEEKFRQIFATKSTLAPSRADIQVILGLLATEQWGSNGDCLRVRLLHLSIVDES